MREGCGGFCSEEEDEQESGKTSRVLDAGGCPPILSQSLSRHSYLDQIHMNVTETSRKILSCYLDWFGLTGGAANTPRADALLEIQ